MKEVEQRYLTLSDASVRYSLCRPVLLRIAKERGALRRWGSNIRIDAEVFDKAGVIVTDNRG